MPLVEVSMSYVCWDLLTLTESFCLQYFLSEMCTLLQNSLIVKSYQWDPDTFEVSMAEWGIV